MLPTRITNYVEQGLALLTSQYKTGVYYDASGVAHFQGNAPQLAAIIASYLNQVQELEDTLWDVWTLRQLANVEILTFPETNSTIDTLGLLVGQPRLGMSDFDYVSVIYVRIAVNRMTGRVTDWSNIANILLRTSGGPAQYYEAIQPSGVAGTPDVTGDQSSAGFVLAVWDMGLNPAIVAQTLAEGCPHGILGELHWSTWPDGNDFEWSDIVSGTGSEAGWGDVLEADEPLTSELGTAMSCAGVSLILGVPPTPGSGGPGGLLVSGSALVLPTLQEAA